MAGKRIQGITLEISGDTTKLSDSLKGIDKQLSATTNELRDINKLLKLDPKNAELLAQKQSALSDAIKTSRERLIQLEKAAEELSKKDSTPELEKQQAALQREIIETRNKLKGFEDELGKIPNKASRAFSNLGEELDKAGKKISEVGEGMTKYVTTPIVGVGAAAVAAFSEVDDAMDTVVKKTGATGEELEGMQKTVERLATTIPTSFEEASQAVGEISTRFQVTGDELESLSSSFLKFSQINGTTVSDSVDRTQRLMAAFGIETKDASKVLDVLSRTAQKSGIRVDKLSDLMTANADSLQKMGMSASDAAEFLGQVETSGADVSAVMKALQKTNQKAAKEGKTMNQVLSEFSLYMKGNATEAEKTQRAIELFGSKAGPAIYNAAKQGTLSFQAMSTTLDDFAGVVDKTFEGTIDGVDNWKMAMNEVKLLGSDIGGILSEFAGPILTKVRDALQEAVGWWRGLSDEQQQNILKIGGVVAAIGPAVSIIGKLTSAVGLLSQGLGILAAHPVAAAIIGLTAAAAAGVKALHDHTEAVKAEYEASYGLTEEVKAANKAIDEQAEKYTSLKERREESFSGITAEYGYLQELAGEYDTYLDDNGQIIEKYKERADFIENQLADALGLEVEDIKEIVKQNGNLSKSIDDIIQKRKAEALLRALENDYVEAIQEREKAIDNLASAEAARDKMVKIREGMDERYLELQDKIANSTGMLQGEIQGYNEELRDLELAMADADKAIAEQDEYVNQARETYENYNATIKNYEGVSAAVIANDTQQIEQSLTKFRNNFKTTETATTETLKKQVDSYKREYENAKKAVESGSKTITQADLAEKQYWYKQAQNEYNKSTKLARDKSKEQAQAYAGGIKDGRKDAESAVRYVGGGVTNELQNVADKAEDYGYDVAQGLANGIKRNQHLATYAAANMANAVEAQLQQSLQIHSPSKLTEYFGRMLDEGLAIGIDGGEAIKAARDMSTEVARQFEEQRDTIVNAAPQQMNMVEAFQVALSKMKVEMNDREMGKFVENTVVQAVYA